MSRKQLFQSGTLGELILKNRFILAPMTRISATVTGDVNPMMTEYYKGFARGGFGALITEGVYTDRAFSQGYKGQPGITDSSQQESWKKLIHDVKSEDTKIIMQLMHAGALSQFNKFSSETCGPSAVLPKGEQMAFYHGHGGYARPKEMTREEIKAAISGFVEAAQRAQDAGVDGIEIHSANGYLLDQFLTDYTNLREDEYGGNVISRVRLTCEIIERVREKVGKAFTLGVRTSQAKVNDFDHKWQGQIDDAKIIFTSLAKAGASYIHTTELLATAAAFNSGNAVASTSLAGLARKYSDLPVIANGGLNSPDEAVEMIKTDQAQFVAIGKGALAAPDLPNKIQRDEQLPEFDFAILTPIADIKKSEINHA
ncbi:NADH:flavin oxidoreductase [Kiloniella majae]|uniref:NADH:flavin oxidoreductase n=1 Tax=Kiloniella majae TaxID=1938558 RepID=UPI001C3F857C|nr:NADH:flavin oxidoreductase [Kiloniella majae]